MHATYLEATLTPPLSCSFAGYSKNCLPVRWSLSLQKQEGGPQEMWPPSNINWLVYAVLIQRLFFCKVLKNCLHVWRSLSLQKQDRGAQGMWPPNNINWLVYAVLIHRLFFCRVLKNCLHVWRSFVFQKQDRVLQGIILLIRSKPSSSTLNSRRGDADFFQKKKELQTQLVCTLYLLCLMRIMEEQTGRDHDFSIIRTKKL